MKKFGLSLITGLLLLTFLTGCARIEHEEPSQRAQGQNPLGGENPPPEPNFHLADTVVEAPGHTGSGFCDHNKAVNGIRGEGWGAGSFDVFSLDNPSGTACGGSSTHLTLRWNGKKVKNGPGADFIVYENGFYISGNSDNRFMDLVIVEVSNDNINWCGFNPDYTNTPETIYSRNPVYWLRFAGKTPVNYNVTVPARNYTLAELFQDDNNNSEGDLGGGDFFDLEDLSDSNVFNTGCSTALRNELKTNGFTYLRLTPAARRNNPDTGSPFVTDIVSNGPDIDGVVARYAENE